MSSYSGAIEILVCVRASDVTNSRNELIFSGAQGAYFYDKFSPIDISTLLMESSLFFPLLKKITWLTFKNH